MRHLLVSLLLLTIHHVLSQSPKREFRGVWIATVNNIDWPSRPGLSVEDQKAELREMLDDLEELGLNAVIFQVRPAGDAFYYSAFEPWSEYLTGVQGKGPDPFFDPLAFMVEECHARAMELHAWVNPFRAYMNVEKTRYVDASHVMSRHPDWVVRYGNQAYIDPGLPEARDYVMRVILDIVYRYDIDGLHIDDYFYPYRIQGEEFPDTTSYYQFGRSFRNKADWRRNNINTFVRTLRNYTQALKPEMKFGISPFGVWRNRQKDARGSQTRAGQTSYDDLYADVRSWLEQGWVDYVAPQLYWSIGYPPASYDVLLNWWMSNSFGRELYLGKAIYKVGNNADTRWDDPEEIFSQIQLDRSKTIPGGSIHFSAKALLKNPLGVADGLKDRLYRFPALPPNPSWMEGVTPQIPPSPAASSHPEGVILNWGATSSKYVGIYRFGKRQNVELENPQYLLEVVSADRGFYLDTEVGKGRYIYVLTGLNRHFQESRGSKNLRVKVKLR
ncbi:MAG: family 10 glycosylhydrolase [Bacteroidota bacterium]